MNTGAGFRPFLWRTVILLERAQTRPGASELPPHLSHSRTRWQDLGFQAQSSGITYLLLLFILPFLLGEEKAFQFPRPKEGGLAFFQGQCGRGHSHCCLLS